MKWLRPILLTLSVAACALTGLPAAAGNLADYGEAQVINHAFRSGTWTKPSTIALALIRATRGTWAASTAYAANDTAIPTAANGRLYRQTVSTCTSGGSQPTWPTTAGGIVADGTCSWTEQTVQLAACTFTEVANANGYARASGASTTNPNDSNWTAPSAGEGAGTGATSNINVIAYGAPTGGNWGLIFGVAVTDSATYGAGNCYVTFALTTPKNVNNGDAAPSFQPGSIIIQIDD